MEKFLNKNVIIHTCLGGVSGSGCTFKGILTSYDDEYVCLNNNIFIVKKFIIAIEVK